MKINDLERILKHMGYNLIRCSKHKIWSNGLISVAIPHHKHVNKILTKHILKTVGYQYV